MKKTLIIAALLLVLFLLVASSVHFEKESGNILIDASRPHRIVWPCEIDIVGEDGEEGFRIGPDVNQGWRNRKWEQGDDVDFIKGDGYATYHFYVPADGDYILWGYALWDDPCTNAVFAKVDQGNDTILGNDPIYKEWHWVRGNSVYLTKGSHILTLSNHSNNVSLQKLMFIGSKYQKPASCDNYFMDIFYDDFDGCDLGNYHKWDKVSGEWSVGSYDKLACTDNNLLIGESNSESACEIRIDEDQWEDYSFDIDVSLKDWKNSASAQIRFGLANKNDIFAIRLISSPEKHKVQLTKKHDKEIVVLGESQIYKDKIKISLNNRNEEIVVLLDDKEVIKTERQAYKGGIGLILEGELVACFDNLHVRCHEAVE